jgi:hypothetical protein
VALVVGLGLVGWFLQSLCGWLVVVGLLSLFVSLVGEFYGVDFVARCELLKFC